jgi:hypothetical protein
MVEPMTPDAREYHFMVPDELPEFAKTDLLINGCRLGKDYYHDPSVMGDRPSFSELAAQLRAANEEPQQAESGNEAGPDRNGKKPRTPKLPNIARQKWWNR